MGEVFSSKKNKGKVFPRTLFSKKGSFFGEDFFLRKVFPRTLFSKKGSMSIFPRTLFSKKGSSKKAEGLPMYAIGIIIIGIIILAVVLFFVFGTSGDATNISSSIFDIQGNITSNASQSAQGFAG